jgi:hypothetical protein
MEEALRHSQKMEAIGLLTGMSPTTSKLTPLLPYLALYDVLDGDFRVRLFGHRAWCALTRATSPAN